MSNTNDYNQGHYDNSVNHIEQTDQIDGVNTRVLLRPEWCLHIGHLGSIYFNHSLAQQKGGHCYLFVNDINAPEDTRQDFIQDLEWLNLPSTQLILMSETVKDIRVYLYGLIKHGLVLVEQGYYDNYSNQNGDELLTIKDQEKVESIYIQTINGELDEHQITFPLKFRLKLNDANNPLLMIQKNKYVEPQLSLNFSIIILDIFYKINLLVDGYYKHKTTDDVDCLYRYIFKFFKNKLPDRVQHHGYKLLDFHYERDQIIDLIDRNYFEGPDDPRLLTVAGLRRKGVPQVILREFCQMGNRKSKISLYHLNYLLQNFLPNLPNITRVNSYNYLIKHVKIVLTNVRPGETEFIISNEYQTTTANLSSEFDNNNGSVASMYVPEATHLIPLSKVIYVDENSVKHFARGTEIELRHGIKILPEIFKHNYRGEITEILARYLGQAPVKRISYSDTVNSVTSSQLTNNALPPTSIRWLSPDLDFNQESINIDDGGLNQSSEPNSNLREVQFVLYPNNQWYCGEIHTNYSQYNNNQHKSNNYHQNNNFQQNNNYSKISNYADLKYSKYAGLIEVGDLSPQLDFQRIYHFKKLGYFTLDQIKTQISGKLTFISTYLTTSNMLPNKLD